MGLHDLRHEISYCLCRPILLLPSGVGIGAEGEARVVVPKHTADRFHIYAVLEGQGCESVPKLVEAENEGITSAVKDRKVPSGGKSRTREADDAAIFA